MQLPIHGLCFDGKGRGLAHPANRVELCGHDVLPPAARGRWCAAPTAPGVTRGGFRRAPSGGFALRRSPRPHSGERPRGPGPAMETWVRFSAQSQAKERLFRCGGGGCGGGGARPPLTGARGEGGRGCNQNNDEMVLYFSFLALRRWDRIS